MKTTIHPQNVNRNGAPFHNAPVSDVLHSEVFRQLRTGTVEHQSHALGMAHGEPLIVAFEALLRYAVAYQSRQGSPLASDGVLGEPYLDAIRGLRSLLNGDGAVAMERGVTTDSKSNGVLESVFWHCIKAGGFVEGRDF